MKIALVGYGKMGKTIEKIALKRGHEIVSVIDIDNRQEFDSENFKSADVVIEFTTPQSVMANLDEIFKKKIPVVCGTTGWTEQAEKVKDLVKANDLSMFWSSNFSLGVNIFMAINKYLAKIMNQFPTYNIEMTEVHHTQKLDAPSGTAITLAEGILKNIDRKTTWSKETQETNSEIAIKSIREGQTPGIHTIRYEGPEDSIEITHDAKSREGFALGAVVAAEFIKDKKGFLGMEDMLKF